PRARASAKSGRVPSARDPDPFPGRAQVEPRAPGEPGGAGGEARVPAAAGVEVTDQLEQTRGGRVEMGGQLGDLVAEAVEFRGARLSRLRMDLHGEPSFC